MAVSISFYWIKFQLNLSVPFRGDHACNLWIIALFVWINKAQNSWL